LELEKNLIDFFLKNDICLEDDITKARELQKRLGAKIGVLLLNSGVISEHEYLMALSHTLKITLFSSLKDDDLEFESIKIDNIENSFYEQHEIYPFFETKYEIYIAISSKLNYEVLIDIEKHIDKHVKIFLTSSEEINELKQLYLADDSANDISYENDDIEKLKELASEVPVIKMINNHFSEAVKNKSSDIHYESS
jgi:general secretion pathway protein E